MIYFELGAVVAFAGTAGGLASFSGAELLALAGGLLDFAHLLGGGAFGHGLLGGPGAFAVGLREGICREGLELGDAFELHDGEIVEGALGQLEVLGDGNVEVFFIFLDR